eukprot:c32321_g1_i1.p1 GENE.c32321_g1_i1~~c32321_g1_i1.p1  ORF type:complete len:364 (+),score=33.85 c32321_g1_i1:65-1093(+)
MAGGFVMSRGGTRLMFSTSLLSVVGTSLAILTLSHEPNKRQTTIILLNLFTSQLLTSLGSVVGEPLDQTFACWWMGIVTNIFTLSSLFWAVVVTFLLFSTSFSWMRARTRVNAIKVGLVCYGLPTFVTFIPLVHATYGAPPPDRIGWCWVVPTNETPPWAMNFWYWMNYYIWVWLCFIVIFLMLVFITSSYIRMRIIQSKAVTSFRTALISLTGYPVAIVLSWFPAACYDFYTYNQPDVEVPYWVRKLGNGCACSMGFLCAVTFFSDPLQRRMLVYAITRTRPTQSESLRASISQRGLEVHADFGSRRTFSTPSMQPAFNTHSQPASTQFLQVQHPEVIVMI